MSKVSVVRALDWKRRRDSYDWHANSPVGTYGVGRVDDRCVAILRFVSDDQTHDERVGFGSTTRGAKAVAQADFETRIRAALSPEALERIAAPASSEKEGCDSFNRFGYDATSPEAGAGFRDEEPA